MIVLHPCELDRIKLRRWVAGAMLGAAVAIGAVNALAPAAPVLDPRMERICGWPTLEGEYMWVMVRGGKVDCGRYR